jgi:hypothetical protein
MKEPTTAEKRSGNDSNRDALNGTRLIDEKSNRIRVETVEAIVGELP